MAGAFVAVADDATAAYWNPAGLSTGAFFSLQLAYGHGDSWGDRAVSDTLATSDSSVFTGLSTNTRALSHYCLRAKQID